MALTATVHKLELSVSDMRRNHFQSYNLTLARHPSETEVRLMVRILAFALHADADLQFSRGLSNSDEPALLAQALNGEQRLWVLLGQPDVKWLKKACGQAREVSLVCYGGRQAKQWWLDNQDGLQRFDNLHILNLDEQGLRQLPALLQRSMSLQCTLQDDQLWVSNSVDTVEVGMECWV